MKSNLITTFLSFPVVFLVLLLIGCSDSTSGNEDAAAESDIESRWAAIVEIATDPDRVQDADVVEFKGYLTFPYTVGGRFGDDPYEEEVITEEEFDQNMAEAQDHQVRNVIINTMVLVSWIDIFDNSGNPDVEIQISGNSAKRTVSFPVPGMPDLDLGSHVSHWVQTGGEWYLQGVDLFVEEPEF